MYITIPFIDFNCIHSYTRWTVDKACSLDECVLIRNIGFGIVAVCTTYKLAKLRANA